jgi:hypothetical protein
MLCCALVAPHVSATALQLLASSLDLFHLDSGGNSITGALRPAHFTPNAPVTLSLFSGGHSDFLYAPEDEDIFFNVSDGSENGSSEAAYEAEGDNVDAVMDHSFSGAK